MTQALYAHINNKRKKKLAETPLKKLARHDDMSYNPNYMRGIGSCQSKAGPM
jgi:hypothetical protein